jgi:hypothetical protein
MALRELLAEFGINVDTEKLDSADKKVDGFATKLKTFGAAFLGAFAVDKVFAFAESVAATLDQVDDTAAALGISADAVQQWGFAARAAGDDAGELLNMMGRLQVSASKEGGNKAFAALGVSAKDATGKVKDADVLFGDVAEGFKNMEDPAKRAALATELFGRQGRKLLPFLIEGRDGVAKMKKEFADLGGGFDQEAIEKGADFQHSMAKVQVVVDGIKGALVKGLFPVLGWIADKAALIGGYFVRMTKNTNLFRNALIVLGAALTPLAIEMAIAFAPILLAGVGVAALILLVDDLFTMFEGGKSVIGDTLDEIFGKGTSVEVVNQYKIAWAQVKDVFVQLGEVIGPIWKFFKFVVDNAGALGDWAAKMDIKNYEDYGIETHAINSERVSKGRAGLSNEQNLTALNAQSYLEAQNRGEDMSKWQPPNSKAGLSRDDILAAVKQWIPVIQTDTRYAQFQPRTYGPSPENPVSAGEVHVHLEAPANMKEHELTRAVAKGVNDARQSANRAAKHTLTQAGQKP